MKRGQCRENCTITPFSTERVSFGRPAICQVRIFTGIPSVEMREAFFVWGSLYTVSLSCHRWISSVRYSPCVCVCVCVCVCTCVGGCECVMVWMWCRRASLRDTQHCSRNGFHTQESRRIYGVLKVCDSCAI